MSRWDIEYSRCDDSDVEINYISTDLINHIVDVKRNIIKDLDNLKNEILYSVSDYIDSREFETEESKSPSFVYFIEAVGTGKIKIGKANNVTSRLNSLQTGNPFELKLVGEMHFKNQEYANRAEKWIHKKYHKYRILVGEPSNRKKTEWFEMDVPDNLLELQNYLNDLFEIEDNQNINTQKMAMERLKRLME